MRRLLGRLGLAAVIAASGCTATDPPQPSILPNPHVAVGPTGAAFYQAPTPPPAARPGDLIWASPVTAPEGSTGFAIMYWSTTVTGALVAVSGVLFQPVGAPIDHSPILAWAHGPFGLGDTCAPSQGFFAGKGNSLPVVGLSIRAGAVFVASDFEGLGTPGEHPFMVNQSSARNILDSIRAAARFSRTDGGAVMVGQSQGGSGVLFAAEIQPTYAPDVKLLGTVGVSVPSDLDRLGEQLSGGDYFGLVLMAVHGFRHAYPDLARFDETLTDAGHAAEQKIATQCVGAILAGYRAKKPAEFGVDVLVAEPDFRRKLSENNLGQARPGAPVLLIHGDWDPIPGAGTRDLLEHYCALGGRVRATFYADKGHIDVIFAALDEVNRFARDRFAGKPLPAAYCAQP
jgi:hypothetical protein